MRSPNRPFTDLCQECGAPPPSAPPPLSLKTYPPGLSSDVTSSVPHSSPPSFETPLPPPGPESLPPLSFLGPWYLLENSGVVAYLLLYLLNLTLDSELGSGCIRRAWHRVIAQSVLLECTQEGVCSSLAVPPPGRSWLFAPYRCFPCRPFLPVAQPPSSIASTLDGKPGRISLSVPHAGFLTCGGSSMNVCLIQLWGVVLSSC